MRKSPQPPAKSPLPDELLAAIGSVAASKISSTPSNNGLTYKQQLKQDAMLWAEYLYSEYKREQASLEEALDNEQIKPTYHDDKIT